MTHIHKLIMDFSDFKGIAMFLQRKKNYLHLAYWVALITNVKYIDMHLTYIEITNTPYTMKCWSEYYALNCLKIP